VIVATAAAVATAPLRAAAASPREPVTAQVPSAEHADCVVADVSIVVVPESVFLHIPVSKHAASVVADVTYVLVADESVCKFTSSR
jgi:hypothetical protein